MPAIALPEYIRACTLCDGAGVTDQTYTIGCGGGSYRSQGSCQICGRHERYGLPGPGYVYRATGEPVGKSVMAQIASMEANHG